MSSMHTTLQIMIPSLVLIGPVVLKEKSFKEITLTKGSQRAWIAHLATHAQLTKYLQVPCFCIMQDTPRNNQTKFYPNTFISFSRGCVWEKKTVNNDEDGCQVMKTAHMAYGQVI